MNALRNALTKLLNGLAGISFIAMVVLTCWQVFTRYVLKNPSSWSEELVSYLFAWASLLGASLITGERGHMNIPIVVERLGSGARKALGIFAELVAFAFSAIIGVWRCADYTACDGTDDLISWCCSWCLLCGTAAVRCAQHDLHRSQYCGYLQ